MKKLFALILSAMILVSLAACSNVNSDVEEVDISALGSYIIENVEFAEQLEELDSEVALRQYSLDSLDIQAVAYASSSAVADTLVIFRLANPADLPAVESAVESRIDYLEDGYSDYGPDEVPKISSAVTYILDNVVVFCICPDNASAQETIAGYFAS